MSLKQEDFVLVAPGLAFFAVLLFLVFVVLWGASCMRRLIRYRLAVDAAIVVILLSWGSVVGLVFGVWALAVLLRKDVRAAFEEVRTRQSEAMLGLGTPRRFSRLALIGALWAVLFVGVAVPSLPYRLLELAGLTALSLPPWGHALMTAVRILGLTAIFGTTILGWIAVAKIRHSDGRLYGLWVAICDGLLFPLLLLNAGLVWLWSLLDNEESLLWHLGWPENLFFMVLTILLSNVLIVSLIWPRLTAEVEVSVSLRHVWMRRLGVVFLLAVIAGGLLLAYCQAPFSLRDGISQESPDGLYSLDVQTRRAMRLLGGDELCYFVQLQGKGGPTLQRWRIPVPTEKLKLAQGWGVPRFSYYSLVEHGRVEWTADSRTVKLLVHDIEVFQSTESMLAFRIVPKNAQHQGPLSAQEEIQLREALVHQGLMRAGADYIWIPYQGETMPSAAVTQSYQGQAYVLASNHPTEIMLPDGTWGLEHAEPSVGPRENPCVSIRFDDRGSKQFRTLTRGHIGQSLGVIIDGRMVSAPNILMILSNQAMISGSFTHQQAIDLGCALRRGMSRRVPLAWSPIKEITLCDIDESKTENLLDLDTGLLWDNLGGSDAEQGLVLIHQQGVDLLFDHSAQGWALITTETQALKLALTGREAWDDMTPDAVPTFVAHNQLAAVQQGDEVRTWRIHPLPAHLDDPITLAFRTHSGRCGLLQVTDRFQSPPCLEIWYKLVDGLASEDGSPAEANRSFRRTQ